MSAERHRCLSAANADIACALGLLNSADNADVFFALASYQVAHLSHFINGGITEHCGNNLDAADIFGIFKHGLCLDVGNFARKLFKLLILRLKVGHHRSRLYFHILDV